MDGTSDCDWNKGQNKVARELLVVRRFCFPRVALRSLCWCTHPLRGLRDFPTNRRYASHLRRITHPTLASHDPAIRVALLFALRPFGRDTTSAGWRRSSLVVGRGLFSLTVCGLRPRDARFSFFCARSGGGLKAFSLSGREGRDSAPRES